MLMLNLAQIIVIVVSAASLFVCVFFLISIWRLNVVGNARKAAIDWCGVHAMKAADAGEDFNLIFALFDNSPSYEKQMWQLTKWKPDDFFPFMKFPPNCSKTIH